MADNKDKKVLNVPHLRFPEFSGEWEEHKLSEVCSFFSGGTPSSSKKEYYNDLVPDYTGDEVDVDCKTLFDSKDENNPNAQSIREIFNEIMLYPRIGVPILIILLGIIDFAKAVMTSKEDEMKASQNKFVKRLIIGIAIFFIPTLVNLIMDLANYIWNPDYVESICKM